MVEKIYAIKNQLLEQLEKDVREKGADRADPQMVDMVKDLAEAEEKCWKAEYYRAVTEAMEGKQGYDGGHMGYQQRSERRGYGRMGEPMGAMGRTDMVESVRMAMMGMSPDERERMRAELRKAMEA